MVIQAPMKDPIIILQLLQAILVRDLSLDRTQN